MSITSDPNTTYGPGTRTDGESGPMLRQWVAQIEHPTDVKQVPGQTSTNVNMCNTALEPAIFNPYGDTLEYLVEIYQMNLDASLTLLEKGGDIQTLAVLLNLNQQIVNYLTDYQTEMELKENE